MVAEMFNIVGFHNSKDVACKNQKAVSKKTRPGKARHW